MALETRQLGTSDLHLTAIGIGAWAIGGEWEFGWGPQDDADSIAAIQAALDRGINWIDTAAVYGLGHSEEVVGRAVKGRDVRVFTKCSLVWDETRTVSHNLEAASIRREAEASLRRLGLDSIDLYQVHWAAWKGLPEGVSPGTLEGAMAELAKLREEGKIRHVGVSNFNTDQIARAKQIAPVVSLQPPYSILRREIEEEVLPFASTNHIGVISYSPMASGLLSGAMTRERIDGFAPGDWRRRNPNFQEPRLTRNLELVEVLRAIGSWHGRTPGEVAIAWTRHNLAITAAIVGIRTPAQVDGVAGALEFRLSDAEFSEIEAALGT